MKPLADGLIETIEQRGWRGRIVPVGRLTDLRDAIRGRREQGLFDEEFHRRCLSFFSFDPPADLPGARSIIIVAVPTPQMRITFHRHGESVAVTVPPTYVGYNQRTESVRAALAAWLEQRSCRVAKARLPLKTLAACSGLAEYGRGNICFVAGMGSFLQLVGAFSDLPCDHDPWSEPKALDRCDSCAACRRHCPTGAIPENRFLLRAERCLTYHNEAADEFPGWIDPSWHHCLIGCMRCQTVCPENKDVAGRFEDRAEFSERETDLLLQRVPFDRLPTETADRLKSLEFSNDYNSICRNLSMIIGREYREG